MSPRTKQNLMSAMKTEASESATFSRFAAHARMESEWDLAETFQENADRDRIGHFAREAALAGLVAGTTDNLRSAIAGAVEECRMYTQFGLEATDDGDLNVATAFQDACREKANQCARLQILLDQAGSHSQSKTAGFQKTSQVKVD
jgi:rubrerythrin